MTRLVDVLTAPTLKNLREQWWDPEFSEFLQDTLRPRPGFRVLDVGCGTGTAEIMLGRLHISQLRVFGVDRNPIRVHQTAAACLSHNLRFPLAAADAERLPFRAGAFDATFCVAVLQHVGDLDRAVAELARVTRPGGRVLAVEPDNGARYWYSSLPVGDHVFELAARFHGALARDRGDTSEQGVGPKLSGVFARHGVEPVGVDLFPVSVSHLGPPPDAVWQSRRHAGRAALERATSETARHLGHEYLSALDLYAQEAAAAGPSFVEIQNTMLFATVGQRVEAATTAEVAVPQYRHRNRTYE